MTSTQDKMALLHYRPPGAKGTLQAVFEKNKEQKAVSALQKLFPSLNKPAEGKKNG